MNCIHFLTTELEYNQGNRFQCLGKILMTTPSVEKQLLDQPIAQLNLSDFCVVTADTSVRETVERMRMMRQHCAFIVGEHTRLLGILTDRDILRKIVNHPETWDQPVSSVMTLRPEVLAPAATTREALRLMTERHFRNVPVVSSGGTVIGNVTQFSVLKFLSDHFPQEVYNLPPDPTNFATQRDGG